MGQKITSGQNVRDCDCFDADRLSSSSYVDWGTFQLPATLFETFSESERFVCAIPLCVCMFSLHVSCVYFVSVARFVCVSFVFVSCVCVSRLRWLFLFLIPCCRCNTKVHTSCSPSRSMPVANTPRSRTLLPGVYSRSERWI